MAARVLLPLAVAIVALASGCGGEGDDLEAEKASDAALVNAAMSRELTALEAYARGLPLLRGPMRAAAHRFRAYGMEYVDALTKALRGLGAETEAEGEEPDLSAVRTQDDFLALAYELENEALATYLEAAPHLYTEVPSKLAASLAAAHAQHLVVLRQGLGEGPVRSVPRAFESGGRPPPVLAAGADGG